MRMNRYKLILLNSPKAEMTCREMYEAQRAVYNKLTDGMDDKTTEILKKHGKDRTYWDNLLVISTSFYFSPSQLDKTINDEIKAAIKEKYGFIPPNVMHSINVFSGKLSSMFRLKSKSGIQRRMSSEGRWLYSLLPTEGSL